MPSRVASDLQLAFGVARVIAGEQVLAAVLDPFHRPAELARRERDQEILRIELAAHAEAAADVGLDHGDGVLGEAHLLRQDGAVVEGHLGGAMHGEMAAPRIPFGEQAARLHRHRCEALHLEMFAANIGGVLERSIRIAAQCRERADAVAAAGLEQQARVGARRSAARDRGQRFDGEGDGIQRVLGERRAVGHHHGDGLTDVAHFLGGDHRLLEVRVFRQQFLPHGDDGDRAQSPADVSRREHGVHAGTLQCGRRLDVADTAVRHRAAQDRGMQAHFGRHVVDELAAAAQEAQILDALDRAADQPVAGWFACGVHGTSLKA